MTHADLGKMFQVMMEKIPSKNFEIVCFGITDNFGKITSIPPEWDGIDNDEELATRIAKILIASTMTNSENEESMFMASAVRTALLVAAATLIEKDDYSFAIMECLMDKIKTDKDGKD